MKKIILSVVLSVIALTTIATAVISCEKKDISQSTVTTKKPSNGDTEKLMPPSCSVTILAGICGGLTCAPPAFVVSSKYNYVRFTKDAYTIANYPANMRYSIYLKGTVVSGSLYNISKVAEFSCTENAPGFANAILNNSTQYYVRITDAAGGAPPASDIIDIGSPSPCIPFFTGTDKGQPC